ncbi:TRAP transporter permease [Methanocella arvoryzae]|uniref:TRAP transporter permease n=1 Tax=Methanocella arvoryzae TaxID=1175445 RepID=UPI001305070B|nr:TRAP transporter permease [Methanocella arvoryzae]
MDDLEVKYSNIRSLTRWGILLVSAIAIISSLYHLYASVYMPNYQLHLSLHLMFMIVLAFFMYPVWSKALSGKKGLDKVPIYDLILGGLSSAVCLYWVFFYNDIIYRSGMESQLDLLVGAIGIMLVLEATRRTVGPALSILAGLFIIYAYVGAYLPGILNHRGYTVERIISQLWYTDQGIFGVPLYVSAIYVIVFILFGSFLKYSGAGDFFINFAYALTGWRKGGPAKTSVLASGFFGMISGSSIANAVTVGSFTIPLMKKAGYRKEFAGAVEAASSTGGQIMPPVMGAAAFIMVEFTGIPYSDIIISALIPAIAFFTGVWIMAHLEASRVGLKSVPKSELPDWKKLLKEKGYVSISVFLLLYLILIAKVSIPYAGVFSIISIIAFSYVPDLAKLYREKKYWVLAGIGIAYVAIVAIAMYVLNLSAMMSIFYSVLPIVIVLVAYCHFTGKKLEGMDAGKFRLALEEGTKGSSGVALACATAGIISGVATLTGLGLKIAMLVSVISGGSLFIALIVTMIACIVLGMGLPTTATYIVLVTMAAPALAAMHLPSGALIPVLAIHMFVLYYGVLADVTPPVALAAYAASGIAKSNQFKTGIEAFKISMNKAMVPFAFVYSPAILLLGIDWASPLSVGSAAFDIATMFMGILCLQIALTGFWMANLSKIERAAMIIAALALIFPNVPGAIYGVAALITLYVLQKSRILAGPDGKFMDGFRKMFPN